jgi:hypothetical protein
MIDKIDYVNYGAGNINIYYVGQNNLTQGNISINLGIFNTTTQGYEFPIVSRQAVLSAFWGWVAEISGGNPGVTLNSYFEKYIIGTVSSYTIVNYSEQEGFITPVADNAAACAIDWDTQDVTTIQSVRSNVEGTTPVLTYQVFNAISTPIGTEQQIGGDAVADGTYAWLANGSLPSKGTPATGSTYFVEIKGGYIRQVELCIGELLNGASGTTAYYAQGGQLPEPDCYYFNPAGFISGTFGFTNIPPPTFVGPPPGSWTCYEGFASQNGNMIGANVYIQNAAGDFVPFTNTEPTIPNYAGQLFQEIAIDTFDVDWSNFLPDQGGIPAPTCTYCDFPPQIEQWVVNLTTGIIEGIAPGCDGS